MTWPLFAFSWMDARHCGFHSHHGVESESQIVKLIYLLQECEKKLVQYLVSVI